jgi:hypothetical protein
MINSSCNEKITKGGQVTWDEFKEEYRDSMLIAAGSAAAFAGAFIGMKLRKFDGTVRLSPQQLQQLLKDPNTVLGDKKLRLRITSTLNQNI